MFLHHKHCYFVVTTGPLRATIMLMWPSVKMSWTLLLYTINCCVLMSHVYLQIRVNKTANKSSSGKMLCNWLASITLKAYRLQAEPDYILVTPVTASLLSCAPFRCCGCTQSASLHNTLSLMNLSLRIGLRN